MLFTPKFLHLFMPQTQRDEYKNTLQPQNHFPNEAQLSLTGTAFSLADGGNIITSPVTPIFHFLKCINKYIYQIYI